MKRWVPLAAAAGVVSLVGAGPALLPVADPPAGSVAPGAALADQASAGSAGTGAGSAGTAAGSAGAPPGSVPAAPGSVKGPPGPVKVPPASVKAPPSVRTTTTEQTAGPGELLPGPEDNEARIVRDGDRVELNGGRIVAVPGKPVKFCGGALLAYYGAQWTPCPDGPSSVTLVGVDLGKLQDREVSPGVVPGRRVAPRGTVIGSARLIGRWANRILTVEQQGPLLPVPEQPDRVPCPPPAGGWEPGQPNPSQQLIDYVNARPHQLSTWIAWPKGFPKTRSSKVPGVVMVGVAHADPMRIRTVVRNLYAGNLCVLPTLLSPNDARAIGDKVAALPFAELGIHSGGGVGPGDRLPSVSLTVLDENVAAALRPIGLDYLDIDPDIRRVP